MHPLDLTFRFDHLPPEGRAIVGQIEQAKVAATVEGLVGDLGFHALSGVEIEATAWPARRDVVVNGKFRARLGFDCVRCLTPRELALSQDVQHVLVRQSSVPTLGDEEFELSDADEGADEHPFDGETVALEAIFLEDLLLELPMNPTCVHAGEPDCAIALPSSAEAVGDLRWAPLAALRAKLDPKGS